ncbi:MAG: cupin domain-containing protein [Alphaproteobacteria bacterium]|jgi:uncharacterized cupin superfamily protein
MANKPAIVNFADAKRRTFGHGKAFKATTARIGVELGAEQIGCALVELEPGKRAWPYHLHYAEEEMFVILEGEGTLRYDGETFPVREGDVIFTPTGPGTAHQIINTSDTPMRYLALSPRADAEVAEYPDSGKVGAYGKYGEVFSFLAPASAGVDYFDGEDGEP